MQKRKRKAALRILIAAGLFLYWKVPSEEIIENPYAVMADAMDMPELYPCGFPVGIYLRTDGIMVIGTAAIPDAAGNLSEPSAGVVFPGDYILSVNAEKVNSKSDLQEILNTCSGNPVTVELNRDGENIVVVLNPALGIDGCYRLGLWVKDDIQGIGTMTYLTQDGHFGALGHPINDTDTGKMVHSANGGLYQTQIRMILKGSSGSPGSFSGVICYDNDTCMGNISSNSGSGIFGQLNADRMGMVEGIMPCQAAKRSEVSCGEAILRSTIGQETRDYQIMILNLHAGPGSDRGFLFEVTDPELLEKTGGIIQGMSGSPILQNGKLIGAVTHVFVQDSTRGYGIYIEDMLREESIR